MLYRLIILLLLPTWVYAQTNTNEIDLLILNKNYTQALEKIESELQTNQSAELFLKQGTVLEKLMDYELAIQSFEKACELDSLQAVYWEELAEAHNSLGEYTDATRYLETALSLDTTNLVLKGKLAHSYVNLRSYPDAFETYSEIYQQDSTNVHFNRYYAYSAYQIEEYELAINLYENLIFMGSRDIASFANLATIYNLYSLQDEAVNTCMKGLALFPESRTLNLKLANIFFDYKNYAEAAMFYKKAREKGELEFEDLKEYGVSMYFLQDEVNALSVLIKCFSESETDPILNFYIGACYKNMNMYTTSVEFLNLAIEVAIPDYMSSFYHHLAQVYKWQDKLGLAIETYEKAFSYDSTNVELIFQIASIYDDSNVDKHTAIDYYEDYLEKSEGQAQNEDYAKSRIQKLREDLFFE